jgi:hypothetical protein
MTARILTMVSRNSSVLMVDTFVGVFVDAVVGAGDVGAVGVGAAVGGELP